MANIFRHLIYEEKPLNAFSIEEEGTMDFALFEVLMTMGQFKDEKSTKRLYNDAYFVCTLLVNYYKFPYMHIDDCKALIKNAYQSELNISNDNITYSERYSYIVLIVSYCLLKHLENWENNVRLKRIIARLGGKIQEKPNLTNILFTKITSATSNNKSIYSEKVFHRRKITKDILTGIDWNKQTKEYNIEKIEEVVGYAASNEEKMLIISSIEAEFGKIYDDLSTVSVKNQVQYASVLGCLKKLRKEVSENMQDNEKGKTHAGKLTQVPFYKTSDSYIEHSNSEKELSEAKETIKELKERIVLLEKEKNTSISSEDTNVDLEKLSITCGPYDIAPKKKTAFVSVVWAMIEQGFFVKREDGSYATNKEDVVNSLLSTKANVYQLFSKALKTNTFMNVFNDLLDKASEMYAKAMGKG